jgi:hypothetical protein
MDRLCLVRKPHNHPPEALDFGWETRVSWRIGVLTEFRVTSRPCFLRSCMNEATFVSATRLVGRRPKPDLRVVFFFKHASSLGFSLFHFAIMLRLMRRRSRTAFLSGAQAYCANMESFCEAVNDLRDFLRVFILRGRSSLLADASGRQLPKKIHCLCKQR